MDFKNYVRNVPNFPKPGIEYKDVSPLLENPDVFDKAINYFDEKFIDLNPEVIVGIESRGFMVGGALAYLMNLPLALVRKKGKLPLETYSQSYDLEYGKDTLEIHKDSPVKGANVIIVDDLLATGGTALATKQLVEKAGGNVVGFGFLVELEFLRGGHHLGVPNIISLVTYE